MALCLKMVDSFGSCEVLFGSMVPKFHKKLGWKEIDLKLYRQPLESDANQENRRLTLVGVVLSLSLLFP